MRARPFGGGAACRSLGVLAWVARLSVGAAITLSGAATASPPDPRLQTVVYDPNAVVAVPVKRGVVTLIVLDPAEAISDVAAGLGGDCVKPESAWCITAQAGGRHIFIKPRSAALDANTLAVVTDQRVHSFRFVVLGDRDARQPVYRLEVRAPAPPQLQSVSQREGLDAQTLAELLALQAMQTPPTPPGPNPAEVIAERLTAAPQVRNTAYSLAEGPGSADIVPTLVFDDGRFTYLRVPGQRELPAVFAVLGDGSETLVNTRMEGDLLVVDRLARRLMLRAGPAVVALWNDAFDIDDGPAISAQAEAATTVPGLRRVLKSPAASTASVQPQGSAR